MILASIGNVAVSCLIACTLPQGVEHHERPIRTPTPSTTEQHHHHEPVTEQTSTWDALAECESHGEWDYGPHSGWGSGIYHGGLQFHPNTWASYRGPEHPERAYDATRLEQIAVAERVLADQGWKAWPACSLKLGLR